MLRLSKKVDYGLILLSKMQRETDPASARDLARRYCLPAPMVANVLKALATAGIVSSTRGAQGGYALARCAREITLADVVHALDGPVHLMDCTAGEAACTLVSRCPTHNPIQAVQAKFDEFLKAVTLQDIVGKSSPLQLFAMERNEDAYLSR